MNENERVFSAPDPRDAGENDPCEWCEEFEKEGEVLGYWGDGAIATSTKYGVLGRSHLDCWLTQGEKDRGFLPTAEWNDLWWSEDLGDAPQVRHEEERDAAPILVQIETADGGAVSVPLPEGGVESVIVSAGHDGLLDVAIRYDDDGSAVQVSLLKMGVPIAQLIVSWDGFLISTGEG